MNAIEKKYWSYVRSMSGQQRVARSIALLEDIREMIACKIVRTQPHLTGRELNRQIAMQLYRNDATTQTLLKSSINGPI